MNLNPFTMLDSLLEDYASPKVRRLIHTVILIGIAIVAIFLGADRDWQQFVIALGVALYAAMNKANTPATTLDSAGANTVSDGTDEDESYEDAGGRDFPVDNGEPPVSGNLID